jgi:hypothetical protein
MKKIFYLFIFIFYLPCVAQETQLYELRIDIPNINGKSVVGVLQLVSPQCWDANLNDFNDHDLTTSYTGSTISTTTLNQIGWNICWRGSPYGFGLGRYKVTVTTGGEYVSYFYIDYRTSDLAEDYSFADDIQVYLNVNNGKLYWESNFTNQVGSDYTLWGLSYIKETDIDLITTELEPLPPTNLIQTASSGSPQLQWQHASVNPNYRTGYNIYRSLNSPNNFISIGTVSSTSNTFTDVGLILNGGGTAYYKITSVNGMRESVYSNTIEVSIVEMGKINQLSDAILLPEFKLEQNYPNPFNPETSIVFSLNDNSFVSLKVYDLLGREVAILASGEFDAGDHKVKFNGNNLESGIYFYEIKADNIRDVKKLILLK